MNSELLTLSATDIKPRAAIRETHGDLGTLMASIRKVGLLHPLIVDRENQLIAGHRRLEACRLAGLADVPVTRLDISAESLTALTIQADENLCRLSLTQEELDKHIRAKASQFRRGRRRGARVFGRLKGIFARS